MPKKTMSSADLKRYALLRRKLLRNNNELPTEKRLTDDQIERSAREAVKMGIVNDAGNVVELPWGSDRPEK